MQRSESTDELLKQLASKRIRRKKKTSRPGEWPWAKLTFVGFCERLRACSSTMPELTIAQRTVVRVAYDKVEPKDLSPEEKDVWQQLAVPAGVEWFDEIPAAARGVLCLVKGGRIGGTFLFAALYSVYRALTADLSTLAPGERASALCVAADLELAEQFITFARGAVAAVPELDELVERESGKRFVIRRPHDGKTVAIQVRAATRGGRAARGRSLVSAVLSEVAHFLDASHVVNDEAQFNAVSPRVLPGGLVVLESTPFLEQGLLYKEFEANFGAPSTSIAVQAPTLLMLPTERNRLAVAAEEQRNPENAAREFHAQFLAFGSAIFFSRDVIKMATAPALKECTTAPGPGEIAGVGGDLGLAQDAAAVVAVHRKADPKSGERRDPLQDVYDVAEFEERKPKRGSPLKLGELVPAFCEFAGRHGQKAVLVDSWSLHAAREHLPNGYALEPADTDGDENYNRYTTVRSLMTEGKVRIPQIFRRLLEQLPHVAQVPKPGGGFKIVLPRRMGTHLDLVAAYVLAVAKAKRAHIGVTTSQPKGGRQRQGARTGGF